MIFRVLKYFFLCFFFMALGWLLRGLYNSTKKEEAPNVKNIIPLKDTGLEKYSIENLSKGDIKPGKITIKDLIKEDKKYNSYLFEFEFSPDLSNKPKTTTGKINIPVLEGSLSPKDLPTILMFRGYIDQKSFQTGDGTRRSAEYFANNGFITMAPDFLGYGGSDSEAGNIFESRFQTYVTALSMLRTIEQTKKLELNNLKLGIGNLFIWSHSNGGQIALTLLEESGVNYPTVLWAPVSKPFPYSVLYYTDDSPDHGKFIRKELSKFEENYDVEKYSLTNYLDKINASILLQQGTADEAVPLVWSEALNSNLKALKKDIKLITYPNTDHNMRPSWEDAVEKDLEFFKSYLTNEQ